MKRTMKHYGIGVIGLMLAFLCAAQQPTAKKRLSFDQIFNNAEPRMLADLPFVTGWLDNSRYLVRKRMPGIPAPRSFAIDISSGKETAYPNLEPYKNLVEPGINLDFPESTDRSESKLLFVKDNDLFLLDKKKKEFKRLTQTPSEEKNPTLSPDGTSVAFTRDNNLYVISTADGKERQLTSDGSRFIYNGRAAWIYYEEILGRQSQYKAFWWSPDSRKLAFYRFDETQVPLFPLFNAQGVHGSLEETPYPQAGDPNPQVRIGIVSLPAGTIAWADFNEKEDQYFGNPFWTPDSRELFIQWLNRGQDTFILHSVDPQTGQKKEIYKEQQKTWIDLQENIHFLSNRRGFFIISDRDGWAHIYYYDMDGTLKSRVTSGKWSVSDIQFLDEENDAVYFTAHKEDSTRIDLYRTSWTGKNLKRVTFGNYTHFVRMSPDGKHFITTYSNVATPPRMALCAEDGRIVKQLGDSQGKDFDQYEIARTELFRIRTSDGIDLPATWILPLGFDPSKKYPVIINVYGGPGAPTVFDNWPRSPAFQWLAQEGAIQMSVDHRGSGHFGKESVALMHRCLGKWEMNDYIEAVKWLHTKPFVDKTKICITGGSYGGYVTCFALTYGADWFTHGVALYSVTDYRLYDSHYTERYMDTPTENPDGYNNFSVMTHAEKYKGMLYIIHGTMDDNVHMQNIIQLVDKLQDLGKHFALMVYPGGRHGWRGPKAIHLRNELFRFYYRYLLEKEFPANLFK